MKCRALTRCAAALPALPVLSVVEVFVVLERQIIHIVQDHIAVSGFCQTLFKIGIGSGTLDCVQYAVAIKIKSMHVSCLPFPVFLFYGSTNKRPLQTKSA